MTLKYKPGGVKVTIGKSQDVSLPARVFRGRATCMHFDTDKSFLLPPSIPGVRNIVAFFQRHPGVTMLINGHTDLVGDAQYNLQLSNERAAAVAAYLLNKVDDWLAWYGSSIPSKRWSYGEDQNMLATVRDATGAPYYGGPTTGVNDDATQKATQRFQADNGLNADGQLGPDTRRALVARYMALEGTSLPAGTPLLQHGCGKFHPIDATTQADQGNRRVEIFLFDGAVDPPPQDRCPAPGCTEYPQWVGNPEEDIDLCQAESITVFRFAVPVDSAVGFPKDALVRVRNGDAEVLRMMVDDGEALSGLRRFRVVDCVPGAQFAAHVLVGELEVALFANAELGRIIDPVDPYKVAPPEPPAADDAGSAADGSEPPPIDDTPLPDGFNQVVAERMALAWSPDDPPDAVGLEDTGDEGVS